jgi:hypothetical protein
MRFLKLSSLVAATAALPAVGHVGLAQSPIAAGAGPVSSNSALQPSAEARSLERTPSQHWDGLDPQTVKRVTERSAKTQVSTFQAELK